jgi:hypothetical protein
MTIEPTLRDLDARNAALDQVEQYDILSAPPERLVAYVGKLVDGSTCRRWLTTWTGERLGTIYLGSGWRVRSYIGSRQYQAYATIKGVEYTGRTFGEGLCISLRMTADAKRKVKP